MKYTVKYRRFGIVRTVKDVTGYHYNEAQNKMFFATEAGGFEVKNWSKCEMILGADWQKAMQEQGAQA